MKKNIYIFLIVLVGIGFQSCTEDSLEPTLAQNKDVETSINNLEDLQGILRGAYNRMTSSSYYGRDFIIYGEVRSDNCYANGNSGRFLTVAAMDMGETDGYASNTWTQIYRVIASANIIIGKEGVELEGDVGEINQVIGQAYAIRALAHFDLLKLYGQQNVTGEGVRGIPYITEYKGDNLTPERNTVAEVRSMIEADLSKALSLMSDALNGSKEFISTYAVYAIRSRVALYFKDWNTVVSASEAIINSGNYSIIPQAQFVASWQAKQNVNSIFELAFSSTDNQNINGLQYIYRGENYGDIRVLPDLQTIFDAGDVRNSPEMIGMEFGYVTNLGKYPAVDYSDNIPLFRYEEIILNYAEAQFELGNNAIALNYLNMIPAERGAAAYTTVTKDNILQERRREFCFEGFRFDDLARTGRDIPVVDAFLQTHGGPTYGSYNYAFPIPRNELTANANIKQNAGY
jgi:hypothetical protein